MTRTPTTRVTRALSLDELDIGEAPTERMPTSRPAYDGDTIVSDEHLDALSRFLETSAPLHLCAGDRRELASICRELAQRRAMDTVEIELSDMEDHSG